MSGTLLCPFCGDPQPFDCETCAAVPPAHPGTVAASPLSSQEYLAAIDKLKAQRNLTDSEVRELFSQARASWQDVEIPNLPRTVTLVLPDPEDPDGVEGYIDEAWRALNRQ